MFTRLATLICAALTLGVLCFPSVGMVEYCRALDAVCPVSEPACCEASVPAEEDSCCLEVSADWEDFIAPPTMASVQPSVAPAADDPALVGGSHLVYHVLPLFFRSPDPPPRTLAVALALLEVRVV
jgi:hypothetical protein